MKKIAVVAYPFGLDNESIRKLKKFFKVKFYNSSLLPDSKKLNKIIYNVEGVIAGTEIYDKKILSKNKRLKIISRVGIGLDSIDLNYAQKKKIYFELIEPKKRKIVKKSYADNFLK